MRIAVNSVLTVLSCYHDRMQNSGPSHYRNTPLGSEAALHTTGTHHLIQGQPFTLQGHTTWFRGSPSHYRDTPLGSGAALHTTAAHHLVQGQPFTLEGHRNLK